MSIKSAFTQNIRNLIRSRDVDLVRIRTDDRADYEEQYSEDSLDKKRFYNVGAGSFYHPYWTNVDYVSDWYGPVQKNILPYDLLSGEPLPIPDGTAELLYTSHTVEHVTEDAVRRLFREALRVLKPGGVIRVTGPDAGLDYEALMRGDHHWFYWDHRYDRPGAYEHIFYKPATSVPLEERWLHHLASQLAPNDKSPSDEKFTANEIQRINSELEYPRNLDFFTAKCEFQPERVGNHISWWTAAKVERTLKDAGFAEVYPSAYGQSRAPVLRNTYYFDSTHPPISFYVEARR